VADGGACCACDAVVVSLAQPPDGRNARLQEVQQVNSQEDSSGQSSLGEEDVGSVLVQQHAFLYGNMHACLATCMLIQQHKMRR
jgi:hypothetical protein